MSKLVTGAALALFLGPVACASSNATKPPPQPPMAPPHTVAAASTVANLPPLPPPATTQAAAPAVPAPAALPAPSPTPSAAADALPQLPSTAAPAAPAVPPAPASVNVADERPFVGAAPMTHASATQPSTTTTTTHGRRGRHSRSSSTPSSSGTPSTSSSSTPSSTTPSTTSSAHRHHGATHERAAAHPEPRIVIDVTAVSGSVQQAEVQRTARAKGWGLVRSCYAEGLRRNQRLGGHFAFDFVIASDGTVASWDRKAATLGDDSVVGCVARELSGLALFKPENANATVGFQVTLSPGDEQIALPHAARNADKLREDLRARWSGVEVCYREGLDRHKDLGGRLELRLRVRPTGEVADIAEGETHFADADVSHCIVELYKNTHFHHLGGRQDETFVYALHLEALGPLAPRENHDHDRDDHDNDDARSTTNEH